MQYYVPLELEAGRFLIEPEEERESVPDGKYLQIAQSPCSVLEYRHPVYGNAIRLYDVPRDVKLIAAYSSSGQLSQVSYEKDEGGLQQIIYLANPYQFSMLFTDVERVRLPAKIQRDTREIARLFISYFYDGEAADFSVKLASPEDMERVRAQYGEDELNSAGAYAARIGCDSALFGVGLLCLPPEERLTAFEDAVRTLTEAIRTKAVPQLHKTAGFQVITEEYD